MIKFYIIIKVGSFIFLFCVLTCNKDIPSGMLHNLSEPKQKEIYSKINIPILFVSGGLDNASPVKISKKYESNSEIKTFEHNAHWMMEEDNWMEIANYITD